MQLLRTVLAQNGEIVLRPLDHDGFLGLTVFTDRAAYLSDAQDDAEWLTTLVHELHHLAVGPVARDLADSAERHVEDATARTLAAMGEVAA